MIKQSHAKTLLWDVLHKQDKKALEAKIDALTGKQFCDTVYHLLEPMPKNLNFATFRFRVVFARRLIKQRGERL